MGHRRHDPGEEDHAQPLPPPRQRPGQSGQGEQGDPTAPHHRPGQHRRLARAELIHVDRMMLREADEQRLPRHEEKDRPDREPSQRERGRNRAPDQADRDRLPIDTPFPSPRHHGPSHGEGRDREDRVMMIIPPRGPHRQEREYAEADRPGGPQPLGPPPAPPARQEKDRRHDRRLHQEKRHGDFGVQHKTGGSASPAPRSRPPPPRNRRPRRHIRSRNRGTAPPPPAAPATPPPEPPFPQGGRDRATAMPPAAAIRSAPRRRGTKRARSGPPAA